MNARHKRKGKALPKPGRSLTAAIAARCAAKTWYNERSPRRAGVTGLAGSANTGVYKERKTHPRNGEPFRLPSPGRHDHDNMCGKAILPAQENRDGSGTFPLVGWARLGRQEPRMQADKRTGRGITQRDGGFAGVRRAWRQGSRKPGRKRGSTGRFPVKNKEKRNADGWKNMCFLQTVRRICRRNWPGNGASRCSPWK